MPNSNRMLKCGLTLKTCLFEHKLRSIVFRLATRARNDRTMSP
jgi:hypothetical protein